jgi:hypothetical protein
MFRASAAINFVVKRGVTVFNAGKMRYRAWFTAQFVTQREWPVFTDAKEHRKRKYNNTKISRAASLPDPPEVKQ